MARHEKIFKREDGSRVKVVAEFGASYSYDNRWRFWCLTCEPRRRTFTPVVDRGSYSYRKLDYQERSIYAREENLKVATPEEVHEVMLELHEKLRPDMPSLLS